MDEDDPTLAIGNLIGSAAGLGAVHAGIIHAILIRRGLTTVEEIIELAEGQMAASSNDFIKGQMEAMIENYRKGSGPVFTVIEGGKK